MVETGTDMAQDTDAAQGTDAAQRKDTVKVFRDFNFSCVTEERQWVKVRS